MLDYIKTVLIISPEGWGTSMLSKHHYALEFIRLNKRVYFLSQSSDTSQWKVVKSNDYDNLYFVNFPRFYQQLRIRYRFPWLYDIIMKRQIKELLKIIPPLDLTVSFDIHAKFPRLEYFRSRLTVLFPADLPSPTLSNRYTGYDIRVSISPEILNSFKQKEGIVIHHGLNKAFEKKAKQLLKHEIKNAKYKKIKIGYIGNLAIGNVLDSHALQSVLNHPQCNFHFWGPYEKSNLAREVTTVSKELIDILKAKENCILHGPKNSEDLALEIADMDGFILCYNCERAQNACSNSHKIMEYLSTGKVVVSTYTSMFENLNLLQMLPSRDNTKFKELFYNSIAHIEELNSTKMMRRRIKFSLDHTYAKNVDKILNELAKLDIKI